MSDKAIKCKDKFFIYDTEMKTFFKGETEYLPWILNAFTDDVSRAKDFLNSENAKEVIENFEETKYEFDGNTPLEKGRLIVVKMSISAV